MKNINTLDKTLSNFKWLEYSGNSCRYDTFYIFYIFCIYDIINDNIYKCDNIIKEIYIIMTEIKKAPNIINKNKLWNYCILKNIDYLESMILITEILLLIIVKVNQDI